MWQKIQNKIKKRRLQGQHLGRYLLRCRAEVVIAHRSTCFLAAVRPSQRKGLQAWELLGLGRSVISLRPPPPRLPGSRPSQFVQNASHFSKLSANPIAKEPCVPGGPLGCSREESEDASRLSARRQRSHCVCTGRQRPPGPRRSVLHVTPEPTAGSVSAEPPSPPGGRPGEDGAGTGSGQRSWALGPCLACECHG